MSTDYLSDYGLDDHPASDQALYAENNARELALWGNLLPRKRLLQRRGYGVWWHRDKRLIRVGNLTLTVKQFKEMADRHARLLGNN